MPTASVSCASGEIEPSDIAPSRSAPRSPPPARPLDGIAGWSAREAEQPAQACAARRLVGAAVLLPRRCRSRIAALQADDRRPGSQRGARRRGASGTAPPDGRPRVVRVGARVAGQRLARQLLEPDAAEPRDRAGEVLARSARPRARSPRTPARRGRRRRSRCPSWTSPSAAPCGARRRASAPPASSSAAVRAAATGAPRRPRSRSRQATWWTSRGSPESTISDAPGRSPSRTSSWCTAAVASSDGIARPRAPIAAVGEHEQPRAAAHVVARAFHERGDRGRQRVRAAGDRPRWRRARRQRRRRSRPAPARAPRPAAPARRAARGGAATARRAAAPPRGRARWTGYITISSRSGSIAGLVTCANSWRK